MERRARVETLLSTGTMIAALLIFLGTYLVLAIGLLFTVLVISLVYRREFPHQPRVANENPRVRINKILLWKSLFAAAGMIVFFFLGWPVAKVAIVTGALLLITRRFKPEKVYREIDWSLLVLFAGLFIVLAGVEKTSLSDDLAKLALHFRLQQAGVLSLSAAIISNIVSNVPAVLVFKPFVAHLPNQVQAWLILPMSSTLAGNLTLLGSIANLIVVEKSRATVRITFLEYLKAGIPLTLLSLTLGIFWLR